MALKLGERRLFVRTKANAGQRSPRAGRMAFAIHATQPPCFFLRSSV